VRLEQAAYEWVPFEERITALQQGRQIREIERLQVAAHIEHCKSRLRPEGLDLRLRAEMIVHAVLFAGAGRAAVEEDHLLQPTMEVGMEAGQSAVEWAFADTGRAGENDEASGSRGRHAAFCARER
jgi:hypothetical protein